MIRRWQMLPLSVFVCCTSATELRTPSAPSLTGTLSWPAGGSRQVTGSAGYWFAGTSGQTPLVKILAFTTSWVATDSSHPALDLLEITMAGARFASFPFDVSMPMGASNGASLGVDAGSGPFLYPADSGGVTVRRLGGGYLHVDLSIRSALFRFEGSLEIPDAGP